MANTSKFFDGGANPVIATMDSLVAANDYTIDEIRAQMRKQFEVASNTVEVETLPNSNATSSMSRFFDAGADPLVADMDNLVAANEDTVNEIRSQMQAQLTTVNSNDLKAKSVRKNMVGPSSTGGKM